MYFYQFIPKFIKKIKIVQSQHLKYPCSTISFSRNCILLISKLINIIKLSKIIKCGFIFFKRSYWAFYQWLWYFIIHIDQQPSMHASLYFLHSFFVLYHLWYCQSISMRTLNLIKIIKTNKKTQIICLISSNFGTLFFMSIFSPVGLYFRSSKSIKIVESLLFRER